MIMGSLKRKCANDKGWILKAKMISPLACTSSFALSLPVHVPEPSFLSLLSVDVVVGCCMQWYVHALLTLTPRVTVASLLNLMASAPVTTTSLLAENILVSLSLLVNNLLEEYMQYLTFCINACMHELYT